MDAGLVDGIEEALLLMDRAEVFRLATSVADSVPPINIIDECLVEVLHRIGAGWEQGTVSLAQVYMSGRICEDLVDSLLPGGSAVSSQPARVALTVFEDHHALGKRIVGSVVRSAHHHVLDWGRTDLGSAMAHLRAEPVEVLLVSVLMLPSALRIAELVRQVRAESLPTRIVVGGAPFLMDSRLWKNIGADAMGRRAHDAIFILDEMLGVRR